MSSNQQVFPLFRIVSPTVTTTLAGATTNANKLFNTNLVIGTYFNIRRVRTLMMTKVALDTVATENQILYELTEDTTRVQVAQTDPFALVDGGYEEGVNNATSVVPPQNRRNLVLDSFSFDPPHPGVPTVAQQLNLVCTGIRVTGASVQSYDIFVQIFYEILPVTEAVKGFLTNRIVLQRTT